MREGNEVDEEGEERNKKTLDLRGREKRSELGEEEKGKKNMMKRERESRERAKGEKQEHDEAEKKGEGGK